MLHKVQPRVLRRPASLWRRAGAGSWLSHAAAASARACYRVAVRSKWRVNSRQIWRKGDLTHLLSIKKMKAQGDLKPCCCADVTVTLTSTESPSMPAALCSAHDRAGGAEAETAAFHASLNFSVVRDIFPIACCLESAEK